MPGKALKLEEAQKKVAFHSGTKMQLGSGWKPGRMGLKKVEFVPCARRGMRVKARYHKKPLMQVSEGDDAMLVRVICAGGFGRLCLQNISRFEASALPCAWDDNDISFSFWFPAFIITYA